MKLLSRDIATYNRWQVSAVTSDSDQIIQVRFLSQGNL